MNSQFGTEKTQPADFVLNRRLPGTPPPHRANTLSIYQINKLIFFVQTSTSNKHTPHRHSINNLGMYFLKYLVRSCNDQNAALLLLTLQSSSSQRRNPSCTKQPALVEFSTNHFNGTELHSSLVGPINDGYFETSNIFKDGRYRFMFAGSKGQGQSLSSNCQLFSWQAGRIVGRQLSIGAKENIIGHTRQVQRDFM